MDRWQRGRALTLAGLGLVGAALAMRVELPLPAEEPEPVPALDPPTPIPPATVPLRVPDCAWNDTSFWTVEPRLEQSDEAWLGRDLLGTSRIEIDDSDPSRAQTRAIEWTRSICDSSPRLLYLVGFEDPALRDDLITTLERACPSLTVRFAELDRRNCFENPVPAPPSLTRR